MPFDAYIVCKCLLMLGFNCLTVSTVKITHYLGGRDTAACCTHTGPTGDWERGCLAVTVDWTAWDLVHMCGPVNSSFSAMAWESVAQFLKGSNSILNAII